MRSKGKSLGQSVMKLSEYFNDRDMSFEAKLFSDAAKEAVNLEKKAFNKSGRSLKRSHTGYKKIKNA